VIHTKVIVRILVIINNTSILRLKLLVDELFKLEKDYQKAKYNHNEIKEERNKYFENSSVISEIFKITSKLKNQ